MAEPVVWELQLPEVTIADILKAEGADYSKRPPRQSVLELHERILIEASALVQPKAIWTEVKVTGTEEKEVFLEGGRKLTSRLLVKIAGSAEKLVLFVMTIGLAIDAQISAYQKAGNLSQAFALDAAASAFIALGSTAALSQLEETYHAQGLKTTFPMGPGHSYWEGLEDQRVIFSYLRPEQAGLHLNDSNLIIPRKSVSMVVGVGRNLPELKGLTHCDFCKSRRTCQINQVVAQAR